jgi:hypothetical protein
VLCRRLQLLQLNLIRAGSVFLYRMPRLEPIVIIGGFGIRMYGFNRRWWWWRLRVRVNRWQRVSRRYAINLCLCLLISMSYILRLCLTHHIS